MIVIIWLISSLILSKAFTGILLSSYFNSKSKPVVTTLQDIRDNENLLIFGSHDNLLISSRINKLDIDNILQRIKGTKVAKNYLELVENVLNGNCVLLPDSMQRKTLLELTKNHQEKIYLSDSKYLPNYGSFFVEKDQNITKIVYF